jgi:recombination protein RecA
MNKTQELANALSSIMKTPVKMASDSSFSSGYWPTGILPIDACLGGGWTKGRMSLVTGESATLKSYVGLKSIERVQKLGGTVALIDTEHAFNAEWADNLGIDRNQLILIQPDIAEEAVDQMEVLVRNDIDMIVFDSIAAMLPKSEKEIMLSGKDNVQPARIAWLMSIALRRLNTANEKTQITWITQKRANIGAIAFGPKTLDTGGKAIDFYVSQRIELRKTGKLYKDIAYWNGDKDATDKQIIAQQFRVELTKSRNRQPFEVQHFVYDLENGVIDTASFLINEGIDAGLISRKGAWWTYTSINPETGEMGDEFKAGSKDKFRELVTNNPTIYNSLLSLVCDKYKLEEDNYGRLSESGD